MGNTTVRSEFDVRDELAAKRKDIRSFEDLVEYLKYVQENGNCGYGASPRAIAQGSLAVAWYLSRDFGITGFQAGATMWDFIIGWEHTDNKCGLRMIDFDMMLYPQYKYRFKKTISTDTWKALQEQAKKNLAEATFVHKDVAKHWKKIARGKVPFGYRVKDNI